MDLRGERREEIESMSVRKGERRGWRKVLEGFG